MQIRLPLLLLAALTVASCGEPEAPAIETDAYLNWGPDATYIGKAVCGECHRENHETFIPSQMGRSFRPAKASLSNADWTQDEPVLDPGRDLWYQPVRRGEELFVREFRIERGDTVHHRIEQINWIVGSGQHTNSHMREINGYLYQIPLTWYAQAQKWGLPPGFDGGDSPRFNRPIPNLCMSCHDGPAVFEAGSENRFTTIPHGIECENCHGPGSVHEDAIRAGIVVDIEKDIDRTIVHPGKLPPERVDDICLKCHMQGAAVLRDGQSPYDFRPGQRLTDYMDVFWPRFPDSTQRFIMASHPDRIRMSACWKEGNNNDRGLPEMTCITCHNPHLGIKAKSAYEYNAPCRACHAIPELPKCTAPEADRARIEDNCSSCHMPQSTTVDIPNVHVTDHYIRVPDEGPPPNVPFTQQTNLVRMASLLRDSVDEATMAEGYMAYFEEWAHRPFFLDSARAVLDRAVGTERGRFRAEVRLMYLREDWESLSVFGGSTSPDSVLDAWTAYRIGESYLNQAAYEPAVSWLERTIELAPGHLRFLDRLGSAYLNAGLLDSALQTFDRILALDPTLAQALNNRGFARLLSGDLQGGEEDIREALRLTPDYTEAVGNLASLLLNTGRADEALPLAQRLVRRYPDSAEYAQFLRSVRSAAGR